MENLFHLLMDKLNNIEQQLEELRELHKQEFKDELMDIIELGKYINYQKTSIYGLVQDRKIPFIKASGKLHFRKSDIDQWLNEGKRKTGIEIKRIADEKATVIVTAN